MADLVNVVNPAGSLVSIDKNQLDAALAQGYTQPNQGVPGSQGGSPDLVNVINPEGKIVSIDQTQLQNALGQGYVNIHSDPKKIQEEKAKIDKADEHYASAKPEHAKLDVYGPEKDDEKTYKMVSPTGEAKNVPISQASQALMEGSKFADPQFQSLYEAYMIQGKEKMHFLGAGGAGVGKFAETAAFGAIRPIAESILGGDNIDLNAQQLAGNHLYDLNIQQHPTAATAGTVAGAVVPLVATEGAGLLGEGAAGEKIAAGIKGALAPEGASLTRQIAAAGLGEAGRGIALTTPQATAQLLINKDPKAAAESIALGGGLGFALGIGGGLLTKALPASLEGAQTSSLRMALKEVGATDEMLSQTESKLGTVEQQKSFMDAAIKEGLGATSSKAEVEKVLQNLAEGDNLKPTLSKLESFLPSKTTADGLQMKIAADGQVAINASSKAAQTVEEISNELKGLTDKDGNITLSDLQAFAKKVGEGIEWKNAAPGQLELFSHDQQIVNDLKKSIQSEAMSTLAQRGDEAAAQAGVKLADEWMNNKYIPELAKQMHVQFGSDVIKEAVSDNSVSNRITKLLVNAAKHHLTGTVGGGLGGVIGTAVGHPYLGAMAGSKIAHAVSHMAENYITNTENASKLTGWLADRAFHPAIASYVAIDAVHALDSQLEKIPTFLKGLPAKTAVAYSVNKDPIKTALGPEANGLSKEQQFTRLSDRLSFLAANTEARQQHVAQLVSPFIKDHPQLADTLKNELEMKIMYLHQIMPKNPNPPQPFVKEDKWKPSKADLDEFNQQLKIAQNPFALLDGLKNGTVTAKQVATAATLNPQVYNLMRDRINTEAFSGKTNLTYQQRLQTSMIMGQAMDASMRVIPQAQSIYNQFPAGAPAAPPQATARAPRGRGGSRMNADKLPYSKATMAQRISNK